MSPKPQRNCEIELYAFNFVVKDKNAPLHASPRQTEVNWWGDVESISVINGSWEIWEHDANNGWLYLDVVRYPFYLHAKSCSTYPLHLLCGSLITPSAYPFMMVPATNVVTRIAICRSPLSKNVPLIQRRFTIISPVPIIRNLSL